MERLLERLDRVDAEVVEEAAHAREDRADLERHVERLVLRLLQDLDEALPAVELRARRLVELGAELRECRELPVLREVEPERTGERAHRADLRRAADAGHGDPDVDRRAHARVEEVRLQEDLAVGDRDDVRRDVGRDVARLRLDDRERGQRAAAVLLRELRRALEKARVEIEDVPRIRLAARRAAQEERDLAVRRRLLREVVVDDERVAAVVEEVLAHRTAGVRREVLERRRLRGRRGDDDRVLHRPVLLERLDDLRDRGVLLPDRDVDADDAVALLVDDRVERERGLPRLAVPDDQLALSAADRDHRVDRLDAGLHRLLDRLTSDDAGRDPLDRIELFRGDRPLAVERDAERVHDAADELLADGHRDDAARPLDGVALVDLRRLAHQDAADVVLLEVEGETVDLVRELEELARHHLLEAPDARDAVPDRDDGPHLRDVDAAVEPGELGLDDLGDLVRADLRHLFLFLISPRRPPERVPRCGKRGARARAFARARRRRPRSRP